MSGWAHRLQRIAGRTLRSSCPTLSAKAAAMPCCDAGTVLMYELGADPKRSDRTRGICSPRDNALRARARLLVLRQALVAVGHGLRHGERLEAAPLLERQRALIV